MADDLVTEVSWEREQFDYFTRSLHDGNVMLHMADALRVWAIMKDGGSFANVARIMSNECVRGSDRITALEDHARALAAALRPFGFFDEDGGDVQKAWEMRYRDRFEDWIDFADIECARAAIAEHQKIMGGRG